MSLPFLLVAALALVASPTPTFATTPSPVAPTASAATTDAPLDDCVATLRKELRLHPEVSAATFDTYTRGAKDLRPTIAAATATQPEFQTPIWDYLARRADAQRIAQGRALMQREAAALGVIQKRGVDAAITVAVFGVETDFGHLAGGVPVVDATLSRACLNLASAERKQHFFSALWLLQEGAVKPEDFRGSWAGAFGMTQFMPGTFVHYMRDADSDAPADIIHSVPDALATTARFLRGMGWSDGIPWGIEVKAPAALAPLSALESDHGCLLGGKLADKCRTVARWSLAGVTRADGTPLLGADAVGPKLDAATTSALLMPAGPAGPAWLVTPNYEALWRYNRADAYALAIGLIADALHDLPPQRVAWPTDDPGISRAEFRELQTLLLAGGHCDVVADGADGPITRAAVRAEEERRGWAQTGHSGGKLLAAMRAEHGTTSTASTSAASAPVASCVPAAAADAPAASAAPASAAPALPSPTATPVRAPA